jgi:hypothetical protein
MDFDGARTEDAIYSFMFTYVKISSLYGKYDIVKSTE